jgi:hypothetical protein
MSSRAVAALAWLWVAVVLGAYLFQFRDIAGRLPTIILGLS